MKMCMMLGLNDVWAKKILFGSKKKASAFFLEPSVPKRKTKEDFFEREKLEHVEREKVDV